MKTNRDLYLAIGRLLRERAGQEPSLEVYLIALREHSSAYADESRMPLATFFGLLQRAVSEAAGAFDEGWRARYGQGAERGSFAAWEQTLIEQIVDLSEMRASGAFDTPDAAFGVTAPRGGYWCNTMTRGFLECAAEGAFGGWEPGDDTGRAFVPGEVTYIEPDGTIGSAPPEAFARPIVEMATIDWEAACTFLWNGRHYE
jgi:hypothetical protein